MAWHGMAWRGMAWHGVAGQGRAGAAQGRAGRYEEAPAAISQGPAGSRWALCPAARRQCESRRSHRPSPRPRRQVARQDGRVLPGLRWHGRHRVNVTAPPPLLAKVPGEAGGARDNRPRALPCTLLRQGHGAAPKVIPTYTLNVAQCLFICARSTATGTTGSATRGQRYQMLRSMRSSGTRARLAY